MDFMDIFNDDAFSLTKMVAAINSVENLPGRVGSLVFQGVSEGTNSLTVSFESQNNVLTLIPTTPRGAPAPKEKRDRGTLRAVSIPQIKLEDTIGVHSIQGVRKFGTTNELEGVQAVVQRQMRKMNLRHDLTLEYHRLGAVQGLILDADGSVLLDLFSLFGVKNSDGDTGPEIFDFDFDGFESEGYEDNVRVKCHRVKRYMIRKSGLGGQLPSTARIWALCGSNFFDRLISDKSVREVYRNTSEQERRLGGNYVNGIFEFAGIVFEEYQGTDDGTTVAIDPDECRFFMVGVPGLYAEYFAPADFFETVNTLGLPRYAKVAPDGRFNQSMELHTQQNPLPICLRPQTLARGVWGDSVSDSST